MRNKKTLTLLIAVAAIVVLVVMFATVFTVRTGEVFVHAEDGSLLAASPSDPTADEIFGRFKGRNILFLPKTEILDYANLTFTSYQAIDVVKTFPDKVTIHLVKRVAVFTVGDVKVDSFGYVMSGAEDSPTVDVTSALQSPYSIESKVPGSPITFSNEENTRRMAIMLETVGAIWQLNYSFNDISDLISEVSFDSVYDTMTLTTRAGAKIVVYSPEQELSGRLRQAFGVYFNDSIDLKHQGVVINVPTTGNVTTTR